MLGADTATTDSAADDASLAIPGAGNDAGVKVGGNGDPFSEVSVNDANAAKAVAPGFVMQTTPAPTSMIYTSQTTIAGPPYSPASNCDLQACPIHYQWGPGVP